MVQVTLVLGLRITHEGWGSRCDPTLNGHLHYLNDIDRSRNETAVDKIRKYFCDFYSDRFFPVSGVHLPQPHSGLFSSHLKSKVGSTLAKTETLRVNLNLDGTSITSRTHTHPSHSQTFRLLKKRKKSMSS